MDSKNIEWFDYIKDNNISKIKEFVKEGFNIDTEDDRENTALIWACYKNHTELAKYLISKKANILPIDNLGRDALDYARENKNEELIHLLFQNDLYSRLDIVEEKIEQILTLLNKKS